MRRFFVVLVVLVTAFLAGCAAPNIVSSVTVFHSLSGSESNKTYMVEATPEQANNLEFNSYVTLLNQELQRHGFAIVNKDPELKVNLKYGTTPTITSTMEPVPLDGYYGFGFGYGYGYGYAPYPAWQSAVDTVYMHQMEVSINQAADGKNIYSVRTRLLSASPELSQSMSYLIESAFQNFPGKNGSTETVSLPPHPQ